MTHGPTTDEVEKIVELQVDGKDAEAKELLNEIGSRYEEDVRLNKDEYSQKLRDMDHRWQQRFQQLAMWSGAMGGMMAGGLIAAAYAYLTGDHGGLSLIAVIIIICFVCVWAGSQLGKYIAH